MAELSLTAAPRLGGYDQMVGETRLWERADLSLVSLACPLGGEADFASALESGYGGGASGSAGQLSPQATWRRSR